MTLTFAFLALAGPAWGALREVVRALALGHPLADGLSIFAVLSVAVAAAVGAFFVSRRAMFSWRPILARSGTTAMAVAVAVAAYVTPSLIFASADAVDALVTALVVGALVTLVLVVLRRHVFRPPESPEDMDR